MLMLNSRWKVLQKALRLPICLYSGVNIEQTHTLQGLPGQQSTGAFQVRWKPGLEA